jgi:ribosomal protein S18 acetylase RimI-like enzyme
VRFANGYSSRANSASAIVDGARFTPESIAHIEQLYRDAGLKPRVRVTPVAHVETRAFLELRGYQPIDVSMTMVRELPASMPADAGVRIAGKPAADWINGISIRQEGSKRSPAHLEAIVSRIELPAAFATFGEGLGYGLCVVDGELAELGSIIIDAGHRGQGLGEAMVKSLLSFAATEGAHTAFLQVDCANTPAVRLYERLGFKPLYRYNTFMLD